MNEFLKGRARMIFALLGGILFLIAKAVFPQMPFTEGESMMFIALIGAYVLGEGLSGKTINDNLSTVLKSQKFQILIAGLLVTTLKSFAPNIAISDTDLTALVGTFMTFIVGAGFTNQSANQNTTTTSITPPVLEPPAPDTEVG